MVQQTPAAWLRDPNGRHELRYWDGAQWTDHVSDAGSVNQDAYDPGATMPPPPPPIESSPNLPVSASAHQQEVVLAKPEPVSQPPATAAHPGARGEAPPLSTASSPAAAVLRPTSGAAPAGQAVSSADVLESEQTLWEGQTQNLTAVASGGKMVDARYRITSKAIYWDRGVMSSRAERVPLAAVTNVVVNQSILQKRRGVGTLNVNFNTGGQFPGMKQLDSVSSPQQLRELILQYAAYEQQRDARAGRTFYAGN